MRILSAKPGKDGPELTVAPELALDLLTLRLGLVDTIPPMRPPLDPREKLHPDVATLIGTRDVDLVTQRVIHCLFEDFHGPKCGVTWKELGHRVGVKEGAVRCNRRHYIGLVQDAPSGALAEQLTLTSIATKGGGLQLIPRD